MPIDVLLVDDHKIMRDGIKAILSRSEEFRVVGKRPAARTRCSS
jgi:DNA-binding NarL/FixJ family response regulator